MIPEIAELSALAAHDVWFTWGHARSWARPDVDTERADRYADWYVAQYVPQAESMDDLPAHTSAWDLFTSEVAS
jgi:hypothetical protein